MKVMQKIKYLVLLLLLFLFLPIFGDQEFGVPVETDLHLKKEGFSLGYSHRHRQAVWVAYTLTAKQLQGPQVRRKERFKADPAVRKGAVRPRDYSRSGYDKGHLAPAADMTYSVKSMNNSFLMTNISPQIPGCNRGIWKRLEMQVRRWAVREEKLYVITGPIFNDKPFRMKRSQIPVAIAFYKIVFDLTPPCKMLAFIIPNQTSKRRVSSFAVSVDEVERITGYDFFSELDKKLEQRLERQADFQAWER